MDKQLILNKAIELLSSIDASESESIELNTQSYSDGTRTVTLQLAYPAEAEVKTKLTFDPPFNPE